MFGEGLLHTLSEEVVERWPDPIYGGADLLHRLYLGDNAA